MQKWIIGHFIITLSLLSSAFAANERPPQFVVISFDNCHELDRWRELSAFLERLKAQQISAHFTFFVSGTNFLLDSKQSLYQGPNHAIGEAAIPFAGDENEMRERIMIMNQLQLDGNEIASHAVGHFDGALWSLDDWNQELNSYHTLFDHMASNNNTTPPSALAFNFNEVIGFRAPYLAVNSNLYSALKANQFRYDASGISNAPDWPTNEDGLWHFDLVRLTIAGTDKKTISMDYNFYLAQSMAKDDPDPEHQKIYKQQMFETYMNYFLTNYHGNRAPLRIGHHFSNFQNGIYTQALLAFAGQVCGLPEVRCVSFKELATYLDDQSYSAQEP